MTYATSTLYLWIVLAQLRSHIVVDTLTSIGAIKRHAQRFYPVGIGHLPVYALLLPGVEADEHHEHQRHAEAKEVDKGVALVTGKENEIALHHFIFSSL